MSSTAVEASTRSHGHKISTADACGTHLGGLAATVSANIDAIRPTSPAATALAYSDANPIVSIFTLTLCAASTAIRPEDAASDVANDVSSLAEPVRAASTSNTSTDVAHGSRPYAPASAYSTAVTLPSIAPCTISGDDDSTLGGTPLALIAYVSASPMYA